MSGYLQRLASQAAKRQGNIRPLVNSFTAPATTAARIESLHESPLEEAVYTSVEQPKQSPKKMQPPAEVSRQESGKGRAQEARDSEARESERRSRFRPLLSGTEEVLPAHTDRAAKVTTSGQETSREEFHSDDAHDGGPEEIVVTKGAQTAGKDRTRSAIVRRQPAAEGKVGEVPPQEVRMLSPTPPRRKSPHLPWSSTSTSRGADEIQINIGRIEVTAMPQAAPRPAPPVRKSINLDEYLSRRNGRNG